MTAELQQGANGKQLDMRGAMQHLRAALDEANSLRTVAQAAKAELADVKAQQIQLETAFKELQQVVILLPEMVEKVSASSAWTTVKAFATSWNPWTDHELAERLLHRREKLIPPQCTDSDWSRHSNFMMRHIGCGHKPPSYYVSYGYYYCSHYGKELFGILSPAGKAWLVSARRNLQLNMEDGLNQNMRGNQIKLSSQKPGNKSFKMTVPQFQLELNDETLKDFAFKTHPLAYLDGGIGHLSPADLFKIMRQRRLQEWGSWDTYEQVGETGLGSMKTWARVGADDVSSATGNLVNRALNFLMAK